MGPVAGDGKGGGMTKSSIYWRDVEHFLALAEEPPQDELDAGTWRWVCTMAAEHHRIMAEKHEEAIAAGTVDQFWREIREG